MDQEKYKVVIIGGGAAGFYAAAQLAISQPNWRVALLEAGGAVLRKVKISGGGRCNVTHACWEPQELVKHYPRGSKELLGPFHKYCTGDVVEWFEDQGVPLKIEDDNRIFPVSNNAQSIIDCLQQAIKKGTVEVLVKQKVLAMSPENNAWVIKTAKKAFKTDKVLIATGSAQPMWEMLKQLGHRIVPPVPSLFTFNTKDVRLKDLAGVSVENVVVRFRDVHQFETTGPLLITHWGLSGPAILKLSAIAARDLHNLGYKFQISINFTAQSNHTVLQWLQEQAESHPDKKLDNVRFPSIPSRLWKHLLGDFGNQKMRTLGLKDWGKLVDLLCNATFSIKGKSTFKEEFVTAGGVYLKEVDFRTMESTLLPGLHFAGEVLDIDAVTGGFNFQAAWTTAWLASQTI